MGGGMCLDTSIHDFVHSCHVKDPEIHFHIYGCRILVHYHMLANLFTLQEPKNDLCDHNNNTTKPFGNVILLGEYS